MSESTNPVQSFKKLLVWMKGRQDFYEWLDSMQDKIPSTKATREIKKIIDEIKTELNYPAHDYSGLSCDISCGSICCYFSPVNPISGVLFDKYLVKEVTVMLDEQALDVKDYIVPVKWSKLSARKKKWVMKNYRLEDYFFELDGVNIVFKTGTSRDKPIKPSLIYKSTCTIDGLKLWVCSKSVACKFLKGDGRCLLGNVKSTRWLGVRKASQTDLRPFVCKSFICSAGYTLYVLDSLGVLEHSEYAGKPMNYLVLLTDNAAGLLESVFLTRQFLELEDRRETLLSDIILTYPENKFRLERDLKELKKTHNRYMGFKKKNLAAIRTLLLSPA